MLVTVCKCAWHYLCYYQVARASQEIEVLEAPILSSSDIS